MPVSPARRFALSALLMVSAGCARRSGAGAEPAASPTPNTVTSEDIARSPNQSIAQLLMAKVPGLRVGRGTDGRLAIFVRGASSFGDQEALVVINGIVLEGPAVGSNLEALDPREIESIEVLKDAAATAMYGGRGANGVVVIKTKQSN